MRAQRQAQVPRQRLRCQPRAAVRCQAQAPEAAQAANNARPSQIDLIIPCRLSDPDGLITLFIPTTSLFYVGSHRIRHRIRTSRSSRNAVSPTPAPIGNRQAGETRGVSNRACRENFRCAWFQVYLGGAWHTFDARHNAPRVGRIVMVYGRDAADTALTTMFGKHLLNKFIVWTDEVPEAKEPVKSFEKMPTDATANVKA